MDMQTYLLKSTIQIFVAEPNDDKTPISAGTGFFVIESDNITILCTLAHVTDYENKYTLIPSDGLMNEKGHFPYFNVGGMVFYDEYLRVNGGRDKIFAKRIDFSFVRISNDNILNYINSNYVRFLLSEIGEPVRDLKYFFKGSINHKQPINGIFESEMHLELNMTFMAKIEGYYIFKCNNVISNEIDYEGCSGAAVIEESGKLVGAVAEVLPTTKFIKVFPIKEGNKLIKQSIKDNLL